jgi:hypothetical protein
LKVLTFGCGSSWHSAGSVSRRPTRGTEDAPRARFAPD